MTPEVRAAIAAVIEEAVASERERCQAVLRRMASESREAAGQLDNPLDQAGLKFVARALDIAVEELVRE